MAAPQTYSWTQLTIWPGDGASPELFTTMVCGLTSKSFAFNADTADTQVPDCTNPDLPIWTERIVRALAATVSGSGVLAGETYNGWKSWMLSGQYRNVRIVVGADSPASYYSGRFLLTSFEITGNIDDAKLQVSVELQSDGQVTSVLGAP